MKQRIGNDEILDRAFFLFHPFLRIGDQQMTIFRAPLRRPPCGLGFDHQTKIHQLPQEIGPWWRGLMPGKNVVVEQTPAMPLANPRSDATPNFQKPFADQDLDGVPDHRSADLKAGGKCRLVLQEFADVITARDHPPPDFPRDLGRQAR